ncbi:DUF2637 domain-containing protein [Streptacidiphilus sp. 4-A2]|nr:DUF2637 domain-containing protein [Streptacidiphilus sp. 4-A2]
MTNSNTTEVKAATDNVPRSEEATATIVAAVLGLCAFSVSFSHVQSVAVDSGQGGWVADAIAASVELMATAAITEIRRRRRRCQPTGWPRGVLVLGVAMSLASNLATAQPTIWGCVMAAWPQVAFLAVAALIETRAPVVRPESEPVRPGPEPVRPEPVRPEPVRPEPVRPEPVRPEPESVRSESVRSEPVRSEPVRPEPEPVRREPARPEPEPARRRGAPDSSAARQLRAAGDGRGRWATAPRNAPPPARPVSRAAQAGLMSCGSCAPRSLRTRAGHRTTRS